MRTALCMLLAAVCALASESNDNEERGSKLPYVADAVGNELPRPSSLPATVGSPVNLLTPDRYEFYTFDESGELVKRLMTLEEIQAIVAAGEEAEGLVTFANDHQPTIAFNFSQPPYTKVHNVVTNVQNVLKAQMEAHKNKPHFQPTLDTPDVSDSWSLILPSIFGNTGVDIGPDKVQNTGSFTTPETETIELVHTNNVDENSLGKEGNNHILISSTTVAQEEVKEVPVTEKITLEAEAEPTLITTTTSPKPIIIKSTTTTTTSTTRRPTTTRKLTTTLRPTTTTNRPTSTTNRPSSTIRINVTKSPSTTKVQSTTKIPSTTRTPSTTKKISTTKISSTTKTRPTAVTTTTNKATTTTTSKPTTTTTSTTRLRTTITTTNPKITTTPIKPINTTPIVKQTTITTKPTTTTQKMTAEVVTSKQNKTESSTTESSTIQYEKISTFIPVSTLAYVTKRTTLLPAQTTPIETIKISTVDQSLSSTDNPTSTLEIKTIPQRIFSTPPTSNFIYILPTTQKPSSEIENDKINSTTITTQSVSPSTSVSSTEVLSNDKISLQEEYLTEKPDLEDENGPIIPIFDVAQSISQIASDLGGNYRPIPTSNTLLDTTKINSADLESKENFEIDIPIDSSNITNTKPSNITNDNIDNFVKISTLDPHAANDNKESEETTLKNSTDQIEPTASTVSERTTIDPFLSESMGDLISQVVDETPQTIATSEKSSTEDTEILTTEAQTETPITNAPIVSTTNVMQFKIEKETLAPVLSSNSLNEQKDDVKQNITKENGENVSIVSRIQDSNISEDKNTQKNQEYIQISESTNRNSSTLPTLESDIKKIESENVSLSKIEQNEKLSENVSLSKSEQNEKLSENAVNDENVSTESISKVDFFTKSSSSGDIIESSTQNQILTNKLNSLENKNKLNKEKIKLPEFQPKIDDFKKKIQKVNIDDKELAAERNNSWKLVSTVTPSKANDISKDKIKDHPTENNSHKDIVLEFPKENQGLEATTKELGEDIAQFTELCNELAFRYWYAIVENIDKRRSFVLSPYSITSMLAMMFMGARGATSGEMNEVLKLDDMVTFNPHFTLKNISDSIETSPESGISISAFIRELYSDKNKGKILRFYKERAQQFYNGHVEEIDFKLIGDKIRRRTNLLVKRYTWGKMLEYIKTSTINMQPPLAAFSANIFETDCSGSSVEGRDGEMYFVVSPNVRQRRLVPVPAVVYRNRFLAGYDPVLDATAAALGSTNSIVSTLFLMPGQQGNVVHSEDLETLEQRLLDANPSTPAWNRLLRTLLPRIGLELQIPRFSHKSVFNVSSTLRKMGLKDLFDQEHADLGGLIGPSKDLYLSDMIQSTSFVTCGEGIVADQHHVEEYPETLEPVARRRSSRWAHDWDEPRDYQRAFHDPHDVGDAMHLPLHLRPRQARLPSRNAQPARLKFDRPFLYFVRHNPTGMILYVGRYNPRLLP